MMVLEKQTAEKIHDAALMLLEDPGIRLDHDEICLLLLKAGAKEGRSTNVIRFPKELIMEKLAISPREFIFTDREGKGKITSAVSEAVIWSVPGMIPINI
jgi:trimethylamine:corrinoid methyltransferase-like protein